MFLIRHKRRGRRRFTIQWASRGRKGRPLLYVGGGRRRKRERNSNYSNYNYNYSSSSNSNNSSFAMSTGKRLAKRSILGTKVTVPGVDGLYRTGFIQAIKTSESSYFSGEPSTSASDANMRYSVRLEDSGRAFEFAARDIVGPGFRGASEVQLPAGQRVFVTHNGREVVARVVRHDFIAQEVLLSIETPSEVSVCSLAAFAKRWPPSISGEKKSLSMKRRLCNLLRPPPLLHFFFTS